MRRRYFEEEMRYLHEAGKAFAEAHPDVGRYLDVDSISDRDPYVERLFEGVAFLTGRIRALLDDELPQYTEGLLSLLYPHFLRPLPAFSIVEMRPKVGMLQETKVLDPGAEVISAPVGSDYMRCRFQSAYPVHLHPMTLAEAALDWRPDQTSSLRLRFDLERGVDITNLDLSRLRLYFHADMQTAQTLHLFATRHVREVVVQAPGGNTVYGRLRGQKWVQPVGFGDQESLLPRTQHEFSGYRLLQEYLCFPSKFLFVDLLGLEAMDLEGQSQFEVLLSFDASYPENQPVSHTNVRLHCTPVVNLYETDAEPFRADGLSSEYRLLPSVRHRSSTEIYDIRSVIGMEEVTGRRNTYEPYFTFKHATQGTPERYYTVHRRTDPQGRPALYLSLHAPSDSDRPGRSKRGRGLMAETISTEVWATNGNLPHEKIQEGMINQVGPNLPQIIQPNNLTRPTRRLFPPLESHQDFFWRLISHWSFNYITVASPEAVQGLLDLYDWTDDSAQRRSNLRRRKGLERVRWASKEVLYRGSIIRGAEVILQIRDEQFVSTGDLCLFGSVMSAFLSMYATVNSFVHLTIETIPASERYTWSPKHGARATL